MHILKGNIGSGVFAMGDAMKNGGLIAAPILTLLLGVICVHSQHILVSRELLTFYEKVNGLMFIYFSLAKLR